MTFLHWLSDGKILNDMEHHVISASDSCACGKDDSY